MGLLYLGIDVCVYDYDDVMNTDPLW